MRKISTENLQKPELSVIIPALNEAKVIGMCLAALTAQTFPRETFEVIVVDNGSSDRTLDIVRSFSGKLRLTILRKAGVTISALRNFGAAHAQGEAFCFLDADCIPPREWLANARNRVAKSSNMVTGARYTIPANSTWVARTWFAENGVKPAAVSYVPGGCLMMTRVAFLRLGGFNEEFETSEDHDLCKRAKGEGMSVLADPALSVVHLGTPQSARVFFRKQLWHGKHVHKAFFSDQRQLADCKSALLGLLSLLLIAGSLLGFLASAVSFSPLYFAPAIAFFAMCAFLAFRMVAQRKNWRYLPHAILLNMLYCVARASCVAGLAGSRFAVVDTRRKVVETA